ncbi:T9SS type A sorting domain-containing protein [Chitinophaga agrisoli]|uniref:T9SS type A sorting domain-containing protein n=1 Tax=Chitinophaga agrisoli TaxID=2607653 RepID=A0A5B2VLR2_9BACT|nr:SGNH/GDSL hydrolase family protein [Chitinophaga agrisoli]KAA2239794.1 T9SS type A sorting domain-containing protein [Chitinophaga agrisoli]
MKRVLLLFSLLVASCYSYAQSCNTPIRIVVLGSSTAWGNGLPDRDSAWVFRYQRYLKQNHHPADTIINLAIGGFTTHEIQPTGTAAYTVFGITFRVDSTHNINRAIALQPDAIIINMPTNDEARGFPLAVQTANYLRLKQVAAQNNIPLWVSTTQPRGNLGYAAAGRLQQMRDTINQYFGSKAIDFWTTLAQSNGYIVPAYNSGDDVHFNAAGQRILFERVVSEYIPDTLCANTNPPTDTTTTPPTDTTTTPPTDTTTTPPTDTTGTPPVCTAPLRIVVLGSSTAWGNGLSNRDSAWVFRYQRYLKQTHNAQDTIINLSRGEFVTQSILPTGTPSYTINGATFAVDPNNNITRAIALDPDVIIINMPHSDEARGFPLAKQTANYLALKAAAAQSNIPLWVGTPQPRSNLGYAAAGRLLQMRDTINKYFGNKAIDFWTGLGDANGYILADYNSGNGVELNAAGHRILFERVQGKFIPDSVCALNSLQQITPFMVNSHFKNQGLSKQAGEPLLSGPDPMLYPNPARGAVYIKGLAGQSFRIEVYDMNGELIYRNLNTGNNRLSTDHWRPGVYMIIINQGQHRLRLLKL